MKRVAIIVPKGEAVLSSIVGPWKVFNAANRFVLEQDPTAIPPFAPFLIGMEPLVKLYGGTFQIKVDHLLDEKPECDLIVAPAIQGELASQLPANQPFIDWMRDAYHQNTEVASLCMGAFLLAKTGLLKGKTCTTHWSSAEVFRQLFPEVELLSDKIITESNGIYTSGGAYSFLNLILYLVEKYAGREVAIMCAKYFEIDINRINQSQFAIFWGQKEHEDKPVLDAQSYIEQNVEQKLSVEDLAAMVALSRRNFIRRFKKATHNTPLEYIQRAKIEAAKKSLESSDHSVYEVMFNVGYSDSKAFRNLFRKFTGLTPNEYRHKYNRIHAYG